MDVYDFSTLPGYLLRTRYEQQWIRIHSLPDSKRYPDTDEERTILLNRHREVSSDVIGGPCKIIASWFWDHTAGPLTAKISVEYSDDYYESTKRNSCGSEWPLLGFDDLILKIANDEIRSFSIYACNTGNIYAPYDGGADLIIPDETLYAKLKDKYYKLGYLSHHPDGL